MSANEQKQKYYELYEYMSTSQNPDNMKAFGHVMNEMMDWMIANKPEAAQEWIEKLESIKWANYLTPKEAEAIVNNMNPKAPWSREKWRVTMEQEEYPLESPLCYNSCALWVTMNKLMSDSSETFGKYISDEILFSFVHDMAVDELEDKDKKYNVRKYFGL